MNWLRGLLERRRAGSRLAVDERWVVVDCETSGLDVATDRLLSIGAVAVEGARIGVGDSFGALLRQERPSDTANILVHGIGGEAQQSGTEPGDAIREYLTYAGDAPQVAYHAAFDRSMLERAAREQGVRWSRRWLDLADLLPVLFSARAKSAKGLDGWLDAFEIEHPARHDAVGDAYATAQLLLVALDEAVRHGFTSVADVLSAAAATKWAGR